MQETTDIEGYKKHVIKIVNECKTPMALIVSFELLKSEVIKSMQMQDELIKKLGKKKKG